MREIKFKVWDKENKKMYYLDDSDGLKLYHYGHFKWRMLLNNGLPEINDENGILMQYTGLKDKNGKKIYEKDFLMINNGDIREKYTVSWIESELRWGLTKDKLYGALKLHSFGKLEVVGNEYENPKLLGG